MLNRLRANTRQPKIAPCQIRGKVTSTYSVNPVFLKKRALRVEHFFEIGADSARSPMDTTGNTQLLRTFVINSRRSNDVVT